LTMAHTFFTQLILSSIWFGLAIWVAVATSIL
jgi:hypothetical protein